MPDIVFPNTFVAGTVLDPADVQGNTYKPESTPQTLEVINGRLDQANLGAAETIGRNEVRRRANATALTRGHTANLDFYDDLFQGDYVANNYDDAIAMGQVVVGTTFYIPYDCEAVYLSWHVGLIIDAGYVYSDRVPGISEGDSDGDGVPDTAGLSQLATEEGNTLLTLHIDGHDVQQVSRRLWSGHDTMLGTTFYTVGDVLKSLPTGAHPEEQWNDPLVPDHRWWSGHCVIDQTNGTDFIPPGTTQFHTKGWHTLDIRVTLGNWTFDFGSGLVKKTVKQVKFKTCRATAIPIR